MREGVTLAVAGAAIGLAVALLLSRFLESLVFGVTTREYLLSLSHSSGGSKARFFRGLGYDDSTTKMLEVELLRLARDGELVSTIPLVTAYPRQQRQGSDDT